MRYCVVMARKWKSALMFLAVAGSVAAVHAAVPADDLKDNYQSIIARNPFGLRDPVVPKPPDITWA